MSRNGSILIVEDELIVALDIYTMLRQLGYHITGLCTSGADALANAEQNRPDLVLMDIHLSGTMDGISTATTLRQKYSIPVIYITSDAAEQTLGRAKKTQPLGYLVKPFDRQGLFTSVELALFRDKSDKRVGDRVSYRMLEELCDGHLIWNLKDDHIRCSNRLRERLDLPEHCHLTDWFSLIRHDDQEPLSRAIEDHLSGAACKIDAEFRARHKDGTWRWMRFSGMRFSSIRGEYEFVAGIHYDVNDRRIAEDALVFLSNHDPMTNLLNRVSFLEQLGERLNSKRGKHDPFAVLLVDLDHLKVINDSDGRQAGDRVIEETGMRLLQELGPGELAARIGGDEFAILVEHCLDRQEAGRRGEEIVEHLRAPIQVSPGCTVQIDARFGVAHHNDAATSQALLQTADQDLFRNQRRGLPRRAGTRPRSTSETA